MESQAVTHTYKTTKLWELFEKKAVKKSRLIADLEKFMDAACNLSTRILFAFPEFTRHDDTHICGVCNRMYELLGRAGDKQLSLSETILLLMAAGCHDLGMLVQPEQKEELLHEAMNVLNDDWNNYFTLYPKDRNLLDSSNPEANRVLRKFIRANHHHRVMHHFNKDYSPEWSHEFTCCGVSVEMLIDLCASHGTDLKPLFVSSSDIDLNFCAVILRLADALDHDANRAPDTLFHFLGLDKLDSQSDIIPQKMEDNEISDRIYAKNEWQKTTCGSFFIDGGKTIRYIATIDDPILYEELDRYLDLVEKELYECQKHIYMFCSDKWKNNNPLPQFLERSLDTIGFTPGDFKFTLDTHGVFGLLSGQRIYKNHGVFVRELLQNSIDAVLLRRKLDNGFKDTDGKISVSVWREGKYHWFCIDDNGVGMDEEIIKKYFLNVGCSYYNDEKGLENDLLMKEKPLNFHAISRFGIGILTCFMGGDRDNRIEVLTRRYTENANPNSAIRLDITGLHGCYFLTKCSSDYHGKPLHTPIDSVESDPYISKIDGGTTICVRINSLYINIESFESLLDNYICFPDLKIEYFEYSGSKLVKCKTYPTRNELIHALDRLNPEAQIPYLVKEHVVSVSSEGFNEFKSKFPELDWSVIQLPSITRKFYPLHRLSGSENLIGAIICYYSDKLTIPVKSEYRGILGVDSFPLSLKYYDNDKCYHYNFGVSNTRGLCNSQRFQEIVRSSESINSISEDPEIIDLFRMLPNEWNSYISYNGIRVTSTNDYLSSGLEKSREPSKPKPIMSLILFSGKYRPTVSIDRENFSYLPLEAACDIALTINEAYTYNKTLMRPKDSSIVPAKDYYTVLQSNLNWMDRLKLRTPENEEVSLLSFIESSQESINVDASSDSLLDVLVLAALRLYKCIITIGQKRIHVSKSGSSLNSSAKHEYSYPNDPYADFPIGLFSPHEQFKAEEFGYIRERLVNTYSDKHPFSVWLIANRERLQENAPAIYREILTVMVSATCPDDVKTGINKHLINLYKLPDNPFGLPEVEIAIDDVGNQNYDPFVFLLSNALEKQRK